MATIGRSITGLTMIGLGGLIGYAAVKDYAVFGPDGLLERAIQTGGIVPGTKTGAKHAPGGVTGTTQKKGTTTAGGRG